MLAILTGNPFFASCLLSSLLLAGWRFLRRDPQISPAAILFPIFWSVGSTFVLGIGANLTPITLDRYLYAADGSFGFQPAFAGARLLLGHRWLWNAAAGCYFNLPFALTAAWLHLRKERGGREAAGFVKFAIFLALAGFGIYFIFPASGPGGAFPGDFPYHAPDVPILPVRVGLVARNCIPSLHTAWILMLVWCAAPMPRRLRPVFWAFCALNLLYALSAGGHYLVDLIVAVPFTVAVRYGVRQAWTSPAFVVNTGVVALWLAVLRFGPGLLASNRAIPYGFTAATLAIAWVTSRTDAEAVLPTRARTSAASASMNAAESLSPGTIR
jgi:hypothetical protein